MAREEERKRERERAPFMGLARVRPTEAMRREAISSVINNESSNGSPLLPLSSFLSNANCFQPPASTATISPPTVARREAGWETGEKRPVGRPFAGNTRAPKHREHGGTSSSRVTSARVTDFLRFLSPSPPESLGLSRRGYAIHEPG